MDRRQELSPLPDAPASPFDRDMVRRGLASLASTKSLLTELLNSLQCYALIRQVLAAGEIRHGRTEKGRRAKGQPALSRGGEQTTRYCAPKSSSGYTAENTRFRSAVRGYSRTGRQAKPNRLSSRRRLLISSLDRRSAACAGARHTLSRRRCTGVPAVRGKSILNSSPVSDV